MAKQLKYQFDINGQTRTLDFGMYCWELFCEKMEVKPDHIQAPFLDHRQFKAARLLVYCGIVANDCLSGQPDSVTEQDVIKWLNADPDVMNLIYETAMKTFYGIDEIKVKEDDKKKVSRSRKSKK